MASNVDRYVTPVEHSSIDHTGFPGVGGGVGDAFPIGAIVPFGGDVASIPAGWLACDDFAYGRTSGDANPQPTLFGVLGTTWGIGDGSTTFNVPDIRARSPMGLNDVTLPNGIAGGLTLRALADQLGTETHTHTEGSAGSHTHSFSGTTSVFSSNNAIAFVGGGANATTGHSHTFSGNTGSAGSHTHTVNAGDSLGPTIVCTYIIKAQQVGGGVGGTTAQENGGSIVGPRSLFNFITGTNITSIDIVDNPGNASVDLTINAASASGAGVAEDGTPVAGSPFSTLSFNSSFDLVNAGGGQVDIELADTAILDSVATEVEINAALTTHRRVLLRPGNYTISGQITVTDGRTLESLVFRQSGQSPPAADEVRFVYTGVVSATPLLGMRNGARIRGITFDYSGLTAISGRIGVDTDSAGGNSRSWATIEDCNFFAWPSSGFPGSPNAVIEVKRADILRCNFNCNGGTGETIISWVNRTDAQEHQPCVIRDCLFRDFIGKGIDLSAIGTANLMIENNQFLSVTGINIHGSGGTTKNVKITNNYFERAGGANCIEGFAGATDGTLIQSNYMLYTTGTDVGINLSAAAGTFRARQIDNNRRGGLGGFVLGAGWQNAGSTIAT